MDETEMASRPDDTVSDARTPPTGKRAAEPLEAWNVCQDDLTLQSPPLTHVSAAANP